MKSVASDRARHRSAIRRWFAEAERLIKAELAKRGLDWFDPTLRVRGVR